MRTEPRSSQGIGRLLLQGAIVIAGIVAIIASSGGGGGAASCAFIIPGPPCPDGGGGGGGFPPGSPPPSIGLTPGYQVVQAGMPASFTAAAANLTNPSYSWCRASSDAAPCEPVPGAYGSSYAIPSTRLSDDGARFRVTATGPEGSATSGFSPLYVSSMPPVVFEDGEFPETDWVVASEPAPAAGIPTFALSRVPAGGNPGAFLRETYDIPATIGRVVVFHSKLSASYHPTSQGAVYLLEHAMDCTSPVPLTWVTYGPMLEQAGRRFATEDPAGFGQGVYCSDRTWRGRGGLMTLVQVHGPACGVGETCPDLSASAAPLRFGFMVVVRSLAPGATQQVLNNYDNWKIKVWRR